jgi:hypothetical protein
MSSYASMKMPLLDERSRRTQGDDFVDVAADVLGVHPDAPIRLIVETKQYNDGCIYLTVLEAEEVAEAIAEAINKAGV